MKMILRPDLRCPNGGCTAAVVELQHEPSAFKRSEFQCKAHGPLNPPLQPVAVFRYFTPGKS